MNFKNLLEYEDIIIKKNVKTVWFASRQTTNMVYNGHHITMLIKVFHPV